MKRYLISTIAVFAVLAVVLVAFGQEERPRTRGGLMSREAQQNAIAAIEKQLAKLKEAAEKQPAFDRSRFQEMSDEERAKFREQMMKQREQQQEVVAAIEKQIMILKGGRQLQAEHDEAMAELQAIHALAVKEKATETAKSIQALIDKRTKALEDTAEKLGIRLRRGRGMGQGQGPGQGRGQGQRQGGGQ